MPNYRPEIDGLRALAVIAVIINHFNKDILPSGYLGVDIFFVISGFVITASLVSQNSNTLGELLRDFYVRRIKRLVPALVLFVLIAAFIICLFNPFPVSSLRTGIASLFGLSNVYLLRQSTDYFAESTRLNVFTHMWSLGVRRAILFTISFPSLGHWTKRSKNSVLDNSRTNDYFVGWFCHPLPDQSISRIFLDAYPFMGAGCWMFAVSGIEEFNCKGTVPWECPSFSASCRDFGSSLYASLARGSSHGCYCCMYDYANCVSSSRNLGP
jgi:hypothetical protein